jgi:hypothetical protein
MECTLEGASMPLKETDLKSLEACRRVFRQDAQTIRTGTALRFWIYQKVGVEKETFDLFPVLMDNRWIRDFMTKSGNAILCHGICRMAGDGRAFIFETESEGLNSGVLNVLKKAVGTLMNTEVGVRVVSAPAKRPV